MGSWQFSWAKALFDLVSIGDGGDDLCIALLLEVKSIELPDWFKRRRHLDVASLLGASL